MKKFFSAIIVICLLLSFAACGEKAPEECQHEWDEGVVSKEAAYKTDGEMLYTCKLCQETKTETIPALTIEPIKVPDDYDMKYVGKVNRLAKSDLHTRQQDGFMRTAQKVHSALSTMMKIQVRLNRQRS